MVSAQGEIRYDEKGIQYIVYKVDDMRYTHRTSKSNSINLAFWSVAGIYPLQMKMRN